MTDSKINKIKTLNCEIENGDNKFNRFEDFMSLKNKLNLVIEQNKKQEETIKKLIESIDLLSKIVDKSNIIHTENKNYTHALMDNKRGKYNKLVGIDQITKKRSEAISERRGFEFGLRGKIKSLKNNYSLNKEVKEWTIEDIKIVMDETNFGEDVSYIAKRIERTPKEVKKILDRCREFCEEITEKEIKKHYKKLVKDFDKW